MIKIIMSFVEFQALFAEFFLAIITIIFLFLLCVYRTRSIPKIIRII